MKGVFLWAFASFLSWLDWIDNRHCLRLEDCPPMDHMQQVDSVCRCNECGKVSLDVVNDPDAIGYYCEECGVPTTLVRISTR